MKRAISKHLKDFIAVVALIAIASGVSYYILQNQRLHIPVLEEEPFRLKGEFITGQAVTPGQGQTVRVSGVRIGDIGKVDLDDGRAIITMDIDRKYEGLVKRDWHALLRPKTGLKDMFIELFPGTEDPRRAPEGHVIPIRNTLPDVNPDEFLASLDKDTRDYLKLLLQGARRGLEGRSDDLNAVLKRFEPTYRDIARVSSAVAERRKDLRRLIRTLNVLNTELGTADSDLAELVGTSARVFDAFARERDNVAATVRELPDTLEVSTDALGRVETFARVMQTAADRIRPAVRSLDAANKATRPFAVEATPLLKASIRPFVREAQPMIAELEPAAHDLVEAEPELKRTVASLNRLFNLLAFNQNGREAPTAENNNTRDEGYLFYLAWLAHQSVSIFSTQDGNGVLRPFLTASTCNTIKNTASSNPQAEALLGLTAVLTDPLICGGSTP